MITIHAYRSWSEDNPKGFIQRGEHGIKPPDSDKALRRAHLATQPPLRFTNQQKHCLIDELSGFVARRHLRSHAASCTPTHLHAIISWSGSEAFFAGIAGPMKQAHQLASKLKNILSLELSRADGSTGKRWFSRGYDCTPVEDREHLNHLIGIYLPKHRNENGIVKIYDNGKTEQ